MITTISSKIKAMYIHIPFCSSICSYCDFCKFYYQEELVDKYLDSLIKEIDTNYKNEILDTIYIGGGTPSSLTLTQLLKLFKKLDQISVSKDLEFTFECNILDISLEKLLFLKKHRVNRLSIGIESFQESVLKILERNYTKKDILEKVNLAKEYFSNINVDLMYAIPGESLEDLKKDLELFLKLDVSHISTYSLIIEEHTKLKINNLNYIDEDLDLKMYNIIHDTLEKNGYIHYEISNFGKNGYQSRHNLTYWKNDRYYGFGLGASGYIDNIRYTNTKNINKYLLGDYKSEEEVITKEIDASNEAILGLRTIYGVDNNKFIKKFGKDFVNYFKVNDLTEDKILLKKDNFYVVDFKYWYILNEILVKFIR